ncbi:pseudouridine synthase [Helicobacter marmotae]|uniref:Pseudouridine synthase n=1 Tax=Helicobacter marmotae TaxID=152490 RepID=A0A3D8I7M3_9HELI|nr:pseudouridine synthase [Helicobacter marmotae]RDU61163.1 rRNA pseudouridine synthase [Helicobacter marmotae]
MRLNQYIAHHSQYSRREADKLIQEGRVRVGRTKATSHYVLQEGEAVFIDGQRLKPEKHFTCIVYHKPKGELVSKSDERSRRVIYQSLGEKFRHFVYVGRLDFASEGLLILTDSAYVAKSLMESSMERSYILKIDTSITQEMIRAMEEGFVCEDARIGGHPKSSIVSMDFAPFAKYQILKNDKKYSKLKVSITEGKNRELRRFFGAFGANVVDLRRISYGFVHLNALPCGKKRYFNKDEYKQLHTFLEAQKQHNYLHKY